MAPPVFCPPSPQVTSANSSNAPAGTAGDNFASGSHLSKKRKFCDSRTVKAKLSRRDTEGIQLLRQIFPEEPDHELSKIHTAYLQKNSSNVAADCNHDVVLTAQETETRIANESARHWQSRQERMDYAKAAVRADDDDDDRAFSCRRNKKCINVLVATEVPIPEDLNDESDTVTLESL